MFSDIGAKGTNAKPRKSSMDLGWWSQTSLPSFIVAFNFHLALLVLLSPVYQLNA